MPVKMPMDLNWVSGHKHRKLCDIYTHCHKHTHHLVEWQAILGNTQNNNIILDDDDDDNLSALACHMLQSHSYTTAHTLF